MTVRVGVCVCVCVGGFKVKMTSKLKGNVDPLSEKCSKQQSYFLTFPGFKGETHSLMEKTFGCSFKPEASDFILTSPQTAGVLVT